MTNAEIENLVFTLNQLVVICKDGQRSFHNAGKGIKNAKLRQLFLIYETQREQFSAELNSEILSRGGEPDKGGTLLGSLHRGWLSLKLLIGVDEGAIVDEAERSDDIAVESYQTALKENLPFRVRNLILRQFHEIQLAHNRISALSRVQHLPAS